MATIPEMEISLEDAQIFDDKISNRSWAAAGPRFGRDSTVLSRLPALLEDRTPPRSGSEGTEEHGLDLVV